MQKKWKIVVTDYLEDTTWEAQQLKNEQVQFERYELRYASDEEKMTRLKDADIIILDMASLNSKVIQALEKCQFIIRHGVGYDNVDLKALTAKKIMFSNIPDYCIEEVAEQAIMLLFACARKLSFQQEVVRISTPKGIWDYADVFPFHCVSGKKLGIIGCGRIGSKVLEMMRAFKMEMLVCDPYLTPERKAELGITTIPMEEVLQNADFVTIHTPLNDETRHLIDKPQLKLMKSTAFLINTARGGIVSEAALIQACEEKWIAGAGIDVFEGREPPPAESKLLKLKNVIMTPHLGWYSEESKMKIRYKLIENVKRFLSGEMPINIINTEVLNNLQK
ncbi:C-terminal binding protein [candidate division KSB1 bacterium]|nr:C-terminal binding protein [candidate division KSB1 bacterium]